MATDDDDDDGDKVETSIPIVASPSDRGNSYVVASVDFGQNANAIVAGTPLGQATLTNVYLSTLGSITTAKDAANAAYEQMRKVGVCDAFLFEEQPPINCRTRMLEAGMASLAKWCGAIAIHVPVSRIVALFELPVGDHAKKKEAATRIATEFIDGKRRRIDGTPMIMVPKAIADGFEMLKRKHDVADALLQFAWYVQVGRREVGKMYLAPGSSMRATDPKNRTAEKRRAKAKVAQREKASAALTKKRRKKVVADDDRKPPRKRRKVSK